mgnify:CR=1 FL=1
MQLKTILNHVEKHKSFVYGEARWADSGTKAVLEIPIQPRANGRPICSKCGCKAPGYDRLSPRRFTYVPTWGIAVFFVYAMRRVDCRTCGVTVEQVPWGDGKNRLTTTYRWFLGDVPLIVRTGDCLLGNYVTVDSTERQTLIGRDGDGVQAVGRNGGAIAAGNSAIPPSTFAGRANAFTR